jgi:hypothetical protein
MNEAYHKRKNFEHPMHSQLIDINNNRCPQLGEGEEGEFKFVSSRWVSPNFTILLLQ